MLQQGRRKSSRGIGGHFGQLDLSVNPSELNGVIHKISVPMEKWSPITEAKQENLLGEFKTMGAYRSPARI
jgi:hypothetical protein